MLPASLTIGRPVLVSLGRNWTPARIIARDRNSIAVETGASDGHRTIHIHESVLHRDVRYGRQIMQNA